MSLVSTSRWMAGFLALVSLVCGFSLDTENATIFRQGNATDFGHTVVQIGDGLSRNWVGVNGQDSLGFVTLFRCDPRDGSCTPTKIKEFINSSSPLSVSASPNHTVICDSYLVKSCLQNTYVPGVCYRFGKDFSLLDKLDIGDKDCVPELVDVVFLFDGSISLQKLDFQNNLKFMFNMMDQADSDMQFAIVQFSSDFRIEMDFKTFQLNKKNLNPIKDKIIHMELSTKTASGIQFTIKNVFTKEAGSREKATKLLIVITDGEMMSDTLNLSDVVELAKKNHITRCAIGVGSSFETGSKGLKELQTIASSPDYLITVQNYDQLESIFQELKSKMFEIEGTQLDKISFEMELAQTGFSLFQSQDSILLGTVGAFDWSGGILEILPDGSRTFINVSKEDVQMKDAYLGYSVTAARIANMSLYIVGAPRYRYKGKVVVFQTNGTAWSVIQNIEGDQMGSYFGSVLCAVDLSGDGEMDLLLIGAPFYHALGYGGMVSVCLMSTQGTFSCRLTLRGLLGESLGRFGSSLSSLGDVTGDGVTDVAVGAPHEEEGRGAVYVFLGTLSGGGVEETFSQRIAASLLAPDLRWFGRSLGGPPAMPGFRRRDLAVGALGTAILLRSRPVVEVRGVVSFNPGKVKVEVWRCPWDRRAEGPQEAGNVTVCFTLSGGTAGDTVLPKMNLTYKLYLDKNQHVSRAVFDSNLALIQRHHLLSLGTDCVSHPIYLPTCLLQAFTPISLNLEMSVTPLSDRHLDEDLLPMLDPNCTMIISAEFAFHNNCGEDDECFDILRLNVSLMGEEKLLLGSQILPALRVEVMNEGEDSFNTSVRIRHSLGLSLKKTIATQIQIICYPSTEPNISNSGTVLCHIGHPVFLGGQKTSFTLTFETENFPHSMREAWIEAEPHSDNSVSRSNHSSFRLTFPVVHEVDVVTSSIPTTRYVIFTNKDRKTEVFHEYKVQNLGAYSVELQVVFYTSVNRMDFVSWTPEVIALKGDGVKCKTILKEIHSDQAGLCSFESAANSTETLIIKGPAILTNEPKDHIEGIVLVSWVALNFNNSLYVLKTPQSTLRRECETEVQMNLESRQDLLIYSAVSGLLLFIPIILVLWKLGFFKRRSADVRDECSSEVKEMMNESPEESPRSPQATLPLPDSPEPAV